MAYSLAFLALRQALIGRVGGGESRVQRPPAAPGCKELLMPPPTSPSMAAL